MKGKDLSKPSVIRHFCRVLNTALFALVLCFTLNNAMALSRNCPAGTYAYLSTECRTCPANCWCPTNGSKQGTGYTTVTCYINDFVGPIEDQWSNANIENGSFDLNSCYLKNNLFPASDAGSDSVTDCYVQLKFSSDNNEESREKLYTYLHGIDNSIFIDGSLILKRCYNNSSGSATTCDIPKLPQPIGDYWYISPKQHFTGEWCSGEELEVTNAQNSNFVTVKIKDGMSSIGPCREYNKYTLLFDANGATGTPSESSVSCMCGTDCTTSDVGTMTRTGYTFNGWNTAADGTGTTYKKRYQYNFCRNALSDGTNIVLYAIWTPNKYQIALQKDDYTFSSYIYTTYDVGVYTDYARTTEMSTTANPATIPEKTGYTFQGFYSTSSGDGIQYILPNGLITAAGLSAAKWDTSGRQKWYARWTPNNYTISLNKNGGTGGITTLYTTYGVDVYTDAARTTYEAPISLPTKAGWTFQGYYSTSSGDGKQYITSNGYRSNDGTYAAKWTASNQTWYARWKPNNYTISLNNNGGWGGVTTLYTTYNTAVYTDSARTTEMSTSANPINVPTKTDWVFRGFYSTSSGVGTQYISPDGFITSAGLNAAKDAMPSQTWYARWGFAGNTVNLYSNCPGGSNTLVATIGVIQNKYMPETDVDGNRLLKPTCPGYRFLGYWDQTSGGKQYYDHTLLIDDEDGGLDTKWDKTSGGNLYAHWEQIPDGFSVDINTSDDEFAFYLTAAGTFKIYWGDGEVDTITKDTTTKQSVYHEYDSSGEYTITITGTSRGYSADTTVPVIEFTYDDGDTTALYGSLGTVFPTLSSTSINGAITQPSFAGTFRDNYNITSIPETLFDNIGGIPVPHMFDSTFENCDSLVTLPTNLFPVFTTNSISNAHHMFYETFYDCGQLVNIPSNLFAGVRGALAESMFAHTFDECDSITSVPAGLFDSISGSLAPYAFQETFYNCRRLETIPADLFSGLSGTPVEGAFYDTFESNPNLKYFKYPNGTTVEYIPPTFFGNIDVSNYQTEHSSYISERDGKEYPNVSSWVAYDMFYNTKVLEKCPSGYEEYLTGFEEEYAPKVSCVPACTSGQMRYNNECTTPDFTLTTTSDTEEFAFDITAAGTWYVDWGDGHIQKIYRPTATEDYTDSKYSSDNTKYYHNYSNSGVYTIKMKGRATDYAGNDEIGSINFAYQGYEDYIASVTGSLGVMFPTINGSSPSFYKVFEDVDNFTGEIPAGLFSGVTECRDHMFEYAFSYGRFTKVPSGLFANIQNNCTSTFEDTFYSCQNLTTVESNAFPSKTACGDREYALTFEEAENLVNIPADMFASNTDGCEEMFYGTFINTGLTSIPSGLFANTKYTGTAMFKETFAGTKITEVPSGLFAKLEYTDENLFYHTFADCENLTTIPADLFSGLSGSSYPSTGTFYQMFNNDGNLRYFKYPNGTTVEYIPPTFFGALEDSGYVSSSQDTVATGMFSGTSILETCPAGTEEFNSVFKTEYAPKVSCGVPMVCASNQILHNRTCIDSKFELTTMPMTANDEFKFSMSASGTFYVDCGDDGVLSGNGASGNAINRTGNTTMQQYTCTYPNAGTHVIKFAGLANGYNTEDVSSTISFAYYEDFTEDFWHNTAEKIASVSGSLGAIFPTLNDGSAVNAYQPSFYGLFWNATNMKRLPVDSNGKSTLFNGVKGRRSFMFHSAFRSMSNLESIPEDLFVNITGAASHLFASAFYGDAKLTAIPENLLRSISGSATGMFFWTFRRTGITEIPEKLFDNVTGNATYLFADTFSENQGLVQLPMDANGNSLLFKNVSGTAQGMYSRTFHDCKNLTSLPKKLFNVSGPVKDYMFERTFKGCSGLTSLPDDLFTGITGSATRAFEGTFINATGLTTIQADLFKDLSGTPQTYMFLDTFYGASNLSGFKDSNNETVSYVPTTLFGNLDLNTPSTNAMSNVFYNTRILTTCPANTYKISNAYSGTSYWNNKVSCSPCPSGTHYNGTGATSVDQCCADGYDWDATSGACLQNGYTITYNAGIGGSGSIAPYTVMDNESFTPETPNSNTITKQNATFTGWSVSGTNDIKEPGIAFTWTYTEDKTFTAIWNCNTGYILNNMTGACDAKIISLSYIDSFDNSVIETTPQMCTYNEAFNLPDTPTRIGYKFVGWELVK